MAPLGQAEKDNHLARVLQHLSQTPYACSSLTQLSGGSVNFVFRGLLVSPLLPTPSTTAATSSQTIIVKFSTDFLALNRDFPLDVSRCVIITPPQHQLLQPMLYFPLFFHTKSINGS